MSCWAACLGGCSQKLTREHIVSKGLFLSEEVTVEGFDWCKSGPKKIGIAGLTAKILCERHNGDLSRLDKAASEAFDAIRQSTRLSNVRARIKKRYWRVIRFYIRGREVERWFLKTLIDLAFEGTYKIGTASSAAGQPSKELVEIAFGLRQFEGRAGLYTVVHVGQEVQSKDAVKFAPLLKHTVKETIKETIIEGGLFSFRGFRFLIYFHPEGLTRLPRGVGLPGEDWGMSQLNFHNKEMRGVVGHDLSHVIHVTW